MRKLSGSKSVSLPYPCTITSCSPPPSPQSTCIFHNNNHSETHTPQTTTFQQHNAIKTTTTTTIIITFTHVVVYQNIIPVVHPIRDGTRTRYARILQLAERKAEKTLLRKPAHILMIASGDVCQVECSLNWVYHQHINRIAYRGGVAPLCWGSMVGSPPNTWH